MISLDRGRVVGYTETPPRVRFRSETYAAEWMSSLRSRIESNCKFGTYRASATKLFLLQLVLLTCIDPNFNTPYLTVTRTCPFSIQRDRTTVSLPPWFSCIDTLSIYVN
jgi:hypothetical protein